MGPENEITVRLASADDADELVRLRTVMFSSMNGDGNDDGPWRASCAEQFRTRIGAPDFAAFVADHPAHQGSLIASGVAMISTRLPGPGNPSGRMGWVQSVVTEEEFRGRGIGTAIFRAIMDWFEQKGIRRVDLHASPSGARIYRGFGFEEGNTVELRWRAP